MSIVTDSLDAVFSDDLAIDVSANGTNGKGLLEQPTAIALGGEVIYYDYRLYLKKSDYSTLKTGDSITVSNVAYTVRQVDVDLDNLILEVTIQKT